MSKMAYLDCNAGISGNMFLGALLDLGLPETYLTAELAKLKITLPPIGVSRTVKQGIAAVHVEVGHSHEHHHRHLADITELIEASELDSSIKARAINCFNELAVAEAKVHGVTTEEIHFHEVGAIDAIVDIVGACIGMAYLKIEKVMVSPVRMGYGTIACAHGMIPLPAPAVVELLAGYQVFGGDLEGEWTTPTGAVLLKTFTSAQGTMPSMKITKIGYGAGTADRAIPNLIRIILGEDRDENERDSQIMLETNIDDMNPELFGNLGELLLTAGARDYYYTPVQMKKNRPGVLISVVAPVELAARIEDILFRETSTLGVRRYAVERTCLKRGTIIVTVDGQDIRVKTGWWNDRIVKYAPEYEDCRQASQNLNQPVRAIYNRAIAAAEKILSAQKDCH